MRTVPHFIKGARVDAPGYSNVFNPATGEIVATVPVPTESFINEVVDGARSAASEWSTSSLSRRTNILFTLRQLLVEHTDELAAIITSEHGKTLSDARGEIARGLENVEYACGLIEHLKGGFSNQVADGVDVHSTRVQFPHHGAAVDERQRHRQWQRGHLEALRARPFGLGASG
jgi:malonate-semialdehyde dehydrogenase (acetylating)/methylmalonate-semialdehyde dehydrogenase